VRLKGIYLTGMYLTGVHLVSVHLIGACISQDIHFRGMHFISMSLERASLGRASYGHASYGPASHRRVSHGRASYERTSPVGLSRELLSRACLCLRPRACALCLYPRVWRPLFLTPEPPSSVPARTPEPQPSKRTTSIPGHYAASLDTARGSLAPLVVHFLRGGLTLDPEGREPIADF
jgi:hypothetical protein